MSDRSYLSIGEVLALLQDEFPDVTISKIRFLESQGLIDPERTPSGYRKFYDPDVERLRFILREQKQHFLPLKVIKDRLESGEPVPDDPPLLTVAPDPAPETAAERVPIWMASSGQRPEPGIGSRRGHPSAGRPLAERELSVVADPPVELLGGASFTFDELATASGLTAAELREVEQYGLLAGKEMGRTVYYDEDALVVARLAAAFARHGVEPRHLRMYKVAADREAGLFEQVVLPLVKQRNPQARGEAHRRLAELERLGDELRSSLLRTALKPYEA